MPRDDEVDADLRNAYRRMATETAPPQLDRAVLEAAANARAPAGRGLWQWRRPLAWVTMIGLSLAIVLEFNRTGTDLPAALEEAPAHTQPAAPADDVPAAIAADEEPVLDSASRFAPGTARSESDDADRAARQALEDALASKTEVDKRSRDEELEGMSAPAAAELREHDQAVMESAAPVPPGAPPAGAPGTAASASAERLRDDADRQADLYIEQGSGDAPACDETTRADPERWRACIMDLLETERAGEALVEIGLYRRAFPDEPPPVQAK
jgi:hypothetical protein